MSNYLRTEYGRDLESYSNYFFNNLFNGERDNKTIMKTNVKEVDEGYQFEMEMPGISKDFIKISLENGYLMVETETCESEKKERYLHRERFVGKATRRFYVGNDYSVEDVKARLENGILYLNLPKETKNKAEKKFITIE